MQTILTATLLLGGLGLVFGLVLGYASRKFAVKIDPKIEEIFEALPGANCGACGFTGCMELARAIVEGKGEPSACTLVDEKKAEQISKILGIKKKQNQFSYVRELLISKKNSFILAFRPVELLCSPMREIIHVIMDASVLEIASEYAHSEQFPLKKAFLYLRKTSVKCAGNA